MQSISTRIWSFPHLLTPHCSTQRCISSELRGSASSSGRNHAFPLGTRDVRELARNRGHWARPPTCNLSRSWAVSFRVNSPDAGERRPLVLVLGRDAAAFRNRGEAPGASPAVNREGLTLTGLVREMRRKDRGDSRAPGSPTVHIWPLRPAHCPNTPAPLLLTPKTQPTPHP